MVPKRVLKSFCSLMYRSPKLARSPSTHGNSYSSAPNNAHDVFVGNDSWYLNFVVSAQNFFEGSTVEPSTGKAAPKTATQGTANGRGIEL